MIPGKQWVEGEKTRGEIFRLQSRNTFVNNVMESCFMHNKKYFLQETGRKYNDVQEERIFNWMKYLVECRFSLSSISCLIKIQSIK